MKKVLSILLAVIMLFTMIPMSIFAADGVTVTVTIESFMRGAVTDLRSSELLEVKVEGYDGNPRELTYKWTSSLGTYLYVYNSHNMYGINNTDGEREIYNSAKKINKKNMTGSTSMAGRTYDKTFKEVGFAWASVYGADIETGQLNGTVTVEVFDKSGKSLGSGSYTNFKDHNLDKDLDNVVIGLFEGDRMDVRDLLGESGVVHITCSASTVSAASILNGGEYIYVEKVEVDRNTNEYYVNGIKAGTNETSGDAQLSIAIKKEYCKFHAYTSGTANPIVYVFKKPKTTTTTTTLTLVSDIDNRCEYFINGNKGEQQPDGTILFTGLDPNTTYTVEVRAEYNDNGKTKYVYGYVEDTTKPVYLATVKTYLDGNLTDISAIHGAEVELLLRKGKAGTEYISLTKNDTGTYETTVENGTYIPYHFENGTYHEARGYELIVENANAELNLHHYTVKYDTTDGAFESGEKSRTEIYSSMSAVNATSDIPVYEGYIFAGWEYDNATYASGAEVTSSITAPITLTAKWVKAVDVTINVTINHKADGGYDHDEDKDKLVVSFLEMKEGTPAFVETGDVLYFSKDGVTDEEGNKKAHTPSEVKQGDVVLETKYTATDVTYSGLLATSSFGVALSKSGYDVEKVEKIQDDNGNWTINIELQYNPNDFNLNFSVEMEEGTPKELYPDAVIVKIACWDDVAKEWAIISQQRSTELTTRPGVRVDIDPETGKGAGSYPVWMYDAKGNAYGYRAVVTGFIYDNSTIIVPTEKDHTKDDNTVIVTYTDGNYTATMSDIADGKKFSTSLNGAYYNDATDAQQGTLHGVISVEKYDVTFDANGGEINGGNTFTEEDEYYVPDVNNYVPTFEGHEFGGWYKDTDFKEPAVSGELLTGNITLYAKWDQILTGYVKVAGSYLQGDKMVDVWPVDRTTRTVIALQEITDDGVYNIDRQTVNITWSKGAMVYGISENYRFTGLDPVKTYRIEVLPINYGTTYQNSTTYVDGDDDYADDYNEEDFKAVYTEDSKWETFVNAYLSFKPASYFQPVEVDATSIGKNLRPSDTLVEIMYKATGSDNDYKVISQHTVEPYGIEIGMGADGMDNGDYGYWVWNSLYDGSLYDYQANLTKLTKLVGEEKVTTALAEWPVSVVYGAPSRYSPLNDAPTGVLLVRLIPNRYNINYHEYYADEKTEVISHSTHIWSYETEITYVPVREGYVFGGWYTNPECTGDKVTAIAETVAADTDLYAKWEKGAYKYTVNYLEEGTNKVLAAAKTLDAKFEDTISENAIAIENYTLTSEAGKTITITTDNAKNVINFYYAADNFGGGDDGTESDGTPDKYQKIVIFKVVNGTWADGKYADIVTVVDLKTDGKYDINGTAELVAPVGMKANDGFEGGEWDDVIPPTQVSGTGAEIYTFSFKKAPAKEVYYVVEHYKQNDKGGYDRTADVGMFMGKVGTTVTAQPKNFEGYVYNSKISFASAEIVNDKDLVVLSLYYDIDKIGGGEDGDESDGTPDMYQNVVVFKVENGTWANGSSDNIVYVLTLDENGNATVTVPEGMKANEGFEGGAWDVTPPTQVSGTGIKVFTYSFTEIVPETPDTPVDPDTPDVPETPEEPDDSEGGSTSTEHHIVFGKTDGIGWYKVSQDGGNTWDIVFGNSTYEVPNGTEIIIRAGDIMGDSFTFYVNGNAVKPDENNEIKLTVNGYMLIGAIGIDPDIDFEVPDVEESLNWFQRLIKSIKDFFAKIGSWFK